MSKTTDVTALIAFHTAPAGVLPVPAPVTSPPLVLRPLRREAQRRFDRDGLPRGLRAVA